MNGSLNLDKGTVSKYWDFVTKRQRIWWNRHILQKPWPWTEDAVLQTYSFTNMYRTLDPGTDWTRRKILANEAMSDSDILFNALLYRLIGRQSTFEFIWNVHGPLRAHSGAGNELGHLLRVIRDDMNMPPFSIAYLVSGYRWVPGDDKITKIENLVNMFGTAWNDIWSMYKDAVMTKNPANVYAALSNIKGIGDFLAYQTFVDLSYPRPYDTIYGVSPQRNHPASASSTSFLGFCDDNSLRWAKAGPGAAAGISNLTGNRLSEYDAKKWDMQVIAYLFSKHEEELDNRDFPWLREGYTLVTPGDGEFISLSFSNIQNTLCEFSKWLKTTEGNGRVRRRFIPPHMRGLDGNSTVRALAQSSSAEDAGSEEFTLAVQEVDLPDIAPGEPSPFKRRGRRPKNYPLIGGAALS